MSSVETYGPLKKVEGDLPQTACEKWYSSISIRDMLVPKEYPPWN